MYNFWQFLHVIFAMVWVGSATILLFISFRLGKMTDNPVAGPASALSEKTAVPVFIVASTGTLITGLIMAFGWVTFDPLWIKIGLVGVVASIAVGIGYFEPHTKKLEAAIAANGPNDPTVKAMIRQAQTVSLVELFVFAVIVWAMVTKPV